MGTFGTAPIWSHFRKTGSLQTRSPRRPLSHPSTSMSCRGTMWGGGQGLLHNPILRVIGVEGGRFIWEHVQLAMQ